MENEKPNKQEKETPMKKVKSVIRNTQSMINSKNDGTIGPKYIFLSLRVPQVRINY